MPGEILRRPQARLDLIDIWNYIADDNEAAADRLLDRIGGVLQMLSEQPKAGRERAELAPGLRSFPVGNYLLFYLPRPGGIDLVRVLSGYMDIGADASRPNKALPQTQDACAPIAEPVYRP